jgi:hypothetical protein
MARLFLYAASSTERFSASGGLVVRPKIALGAAKKLGAVEGYGLEGYIAE